MHIYAIVTLNTNNRNSHLLWVYGFVTYLAGGHKATQRREMAWTEMAPMWVMFAERRRYVIDVY